MPDVATFTPPLAPVPRPQVTTRIGRVDPTAVDGWDAAIAACGGASFFHGTAWAHVLKGAYGYQPAYFTLRAENELRAVLPLMEVNSWLTGRRGIGLPFTDECPPIGADAGDFTALHAAALEHGRQRRWKYLECRGGRSWFGDVPPSASFLGHRLALQGGEAALFARFDSSVRRAVRKAEQSALTVEFSRDIEAIRAFHHLMCLTRKKHGVPPQPLHFFECIHRHVLAQNQGWVVLARHNGVPIAGAVYFHFAGTAIYKYGASDEAFLHLRANNLVMWEAIKRHAADGFNTLDFGRTALDNEGLRKFKLSWATVEHPVDYIRQELPAGAFVPAKAAGSGWETRIFQSLPDPILRLIGAALYKHVA